LPYMLSRLIMSCLEKRPERRTQSAEILVAMLDACDDVEPWTRKMGRAWWTSHGRAALRQLRHQTATGDRRSQPAASTRGISIIRPAESLRGTTGNPASADALDSLDTFMPSRKRALR
jgi:hypothetical protein